MHALGLLGPDTYVQTHTGDHGVRTGTVGTEHTRTDRYREPRCTYWDYWDRTRSHTHTGDHGVRTETSGSERPRVPGRRNRRTID